MVSEEIGLNAHFGAAGIEVAETDLGEHIIQLRGETPSHIIAPVIHLNRQEIAESFVRAHSGLPSERPLETVEDLVAEARAVLRDKFLAADVGITGANLLIAETGSSVIVTNEGNGDLTETLPRMHIVIASIEKIVPTLEDACTILRLLARSGTGQDITTYTTFATGPAREGDPDGPRAYHVVLLDNGRSEMLGGDFRDMLRCIRCGACLNHCPVYGAIGGHAYGSLYPGPMGAVLTPALYGLAAARDLPNASSFCGRCEEVCPMAIPLPSLMRRWRERDFEERGAPLAQRLALKFWAFAAKRPRLYHTLAGIIAPLLAWFAGERGRFRSLPFAQAWTKTHDLPAPEGRTFQALYRQRMRSGVR
jgi:L-lactate dehydrogenase complex protein LldF